MVHVKSRTAARRVPRLERRRARRVPWKTRISTGARKVPYDFPFGGVPVTLGERVCAILGSGASLLQVHIAGAGNRRAPTNVTPSRP